MKSLQIIQTGVQASFQKLIDPVEIMMAQSRQIKLHHLILPRVQIVLDVRAVYLKTKSSISDTRWYCCLGLFRWSCNQHRYNWSSYDQYGFLCRYSRSGNVFCSEWNFLRCTTNYDNDYYYYDYHRNKCRYWNQYCWYQNYLLLIFQKQQPDASWRFTAATLVNNPIKFVYSSSKCLHFSVQLAIKDAVFRRNENLVNDRLHRMKIPKMICESLLWLINLRL